MKGTLYLCATPIGNLKDITLRCIETLESVDLIAAEDTRQTLKLLNHFDIHKPMTSYFEHNKKEKGEVIVSRLLAGESCALVTDAGTPAISDPGEDMVALCAERGIPVTSVPGPVASITALTLSGLPTGRFTFEGFLSVNKAERRTHLSSLANETRTMLFHEAPHKLQATLDDLARTFGEDRRIAICRELTKAHEEILRLTIGEAVAYYKEQSPRGEYVLVVEGAKDAVSTSFWNAMDVPSHVAHYINSGMAKMDAIKQVARDRGVAKNEIYKQMVD